MDINEIEKALAAMDTRIERTVNYSGSTWADPWSTVFGGSGIPSTIHTATALNCETVRACLEALALPMDQIDLVAIDENRNEITSGPVAALLEKSGGARATITAHAALLGDGIAFINFDSQLQPLDLIPLDPRNTTMQTLPDGSKVYNTRSITGDNVLLLDWQVWHVRNLSWDGSRGLRALDAIQNPLKITIAQNSYSIGYYENGGTPSYVVKIPRDWEPAVKKSFVDEFLAKHKGASKSFSTYFSFEGEELSPLGIPQRDQQFIELSKLSEEKICRVLGVPPSMIGILEKTTFNTAPEQQRAFIAQRLGYWFKQHERQARKLLPSGSPLKIEWQLNEWLRMNPAELKDYTSGLVEKALITPNEGRRLLGLPPSSDPIADRLQLAYAKANTADTTSEAQEPAQVPPVDTQRSEAPTPSPTPQARTIDLSPIVDDVSERVSKLASHAILRGTRSEDWFTNHGKVCREVLSPLATVASIAPDDLETIVSEWITHTRESRHEKEYLSKLIRETLHK